MRKGMYDACIPRAGMRTPLHAHEEAGSHERDSVWVALGCLGLQVYSTSSCRL